MKRFYEEDKHTSNEVYLSDLENTLRKLLGIDQPSYRTGWRESNSGIAPLSWRNQSLNFVKHFALAPQIENVFLSMGSRGPWEGQPGIVSRFSISSIVRI